MKKSILWKRIKNFLTRLQKYISLHIKVVSLFVIGLIFIFFLSLFLAYHSKSGANTNLNSQKITSQLNQIDSQLANLRNNVVDNEAQSAATRKILQEIKNLQSSMKNIPKNDKVQQLVASIQSDHHSLSKKLNILQRLVYQIKRQVTPIHYLPKSALPFHVVSVDIWNGITYATIKLSQHYSLVGMRETRCGWEVVNLDYEKQLVIFENKHHQYVRVKLN